VTYEEDVARVDEIVRVKSAGCCSPERPGGLCRFHSGYRDAWLEMAEQVRALELGG
jgi:hypothetical protein